MQTRQPSAAELKALTTLLDVLRELPPTRERFAVVRLLGAAVDTGRDLTVEALSRFGTALDVLKELPHGGYRAFVIGLAEEQVVRELQIEARRARHSCCTSDPSP